MDREKHLSSILAGSHDSSTGIVVLKRRDSPGSSIRFKRKDFNASRSARCISRTGIVAGCSGRSRAFGNQYWAGNSSPASPTCRGVVRSG